jgi:glucan-binding YG repeat protein
MLPEFIAHERINTTWFIDWDNHVWFYYNPEKGTMMTHEPKKSWRRF